MPKVARYNKQGQALMAHAMVNSGIDNLIELERRSGVPYSRLHRVLSASGSFDMVRLCELKPIMKAAGMKPEDLAEVLI